MPILLPRVFECLFDSICPFSNNLCTHLNRNKYVRFQLEGFCGQIDWRRAQDEWSSGYSHLLKFNPLKSIENLSPSNFLMNALLWTVLTGE